MYVISKLGEDGCSKKVAEFNGEVIDRLSMDGRQTITNMAVEMSARSSIMNPDSKTLDFINSRVKTRFDVFRSDKDASFSETELYDLSDLEPQVAKPYSPANSVSVSEVKGISINKAFIGSCTNGGAEDLEIAARILKGKKINDKIQFSVVPATKKIYEWAQKNGIIEIYIESGAKIYPPSCALCFGVTMKLGPDDVCISTINRNYHGRAGHPNSKMYLASPATVASSAIYGKITDPREVK
jgi:homoaconitase/3-isopropylmalate dehydratase large subunit